MAAIDRCTERPPAIIQLYFSITNVGYDLDLRHSSETLVQWPLSHKNILTSLDILKIKQLKIEGISTQNL